MKRGGLIVVHMTRREWRWLLDRLSSTINSLDIVRAGGDITPTERRKLTMLREFHDTVVEAGGDDS